MMANLLVATKLFVPKLRDGALERHRLNERLERGATSKLTLVSAPAGFGKTTAVARWLASRSPPSRGVAWLSLDHSDNDAATFWTNLIAALQKAMAELGAAPLQVPNPGHFPADLIVTSIVNELDRVLEGRLVLVLDDYHVIAEPDVQAGMASLLEHLPQRVHIVITTRADPALPLARLRARGELAEIRSADLRFSVDEIAAYLNVILALGLTERDIVALEDRTEGWIAALQLAALSMQSRDDVTSFVAGFTGNDRFVFDYLVEEVLELQSDEVRSFLLETCFLDRLHGPLCDAVTGRSNSKRTLEALYRANLFVIPLDDRREWYRYHHLFADVLLTQLDDAATKELPAFHRRASDWYERRGERSEAIKQALAGKSYERAAELIEFAIPEAQRERRETVLLSWMRQLPDELFHNRPVLGIGYAGALASTGELNRVEDRLVEVERSLLAMADADRTPEGCATCEVIVADRTQLPRVPSAIERYRAALAQIRGDVASTIAHAARALELAPEDDHLGHAAASTLLGIGHWAGGNLEAASRWWNEGKTGLLRAGHIADTLGVNIALADIHLAQGKLQEAKQVYVQALEFSGEQGGQVLRGTAEMHSGLSEIYRERNDLNAARQHVLKSQELGEGAGLPQYSFRWRVAAALLRQDEGDSEGAIELLNAAERLYVSDFFPNIRPVAAIRARTFIAQANLDEAVRWQRNGKVGVDDELSYPREYEHITLARLLLAQVRRGQPVGATGLLDFLSRLLAAAERGGRAGSATELLMLQALALRHTNIQGALVPLERALSHAADEGYARLFINEGEPMEALLTLAVKRRIQVGYARKLLTSIGRPQMRSAMSGNMIEPLSERELDVLRLLGSDLAGPEIARELTVSPNTMRTHAKNIYEKLGVNSRRAAVRRAEELGLMVRRNTSR